MSTLVINEALKKLNYSVAVQDYNDIYAPTTTRNIIR